MYKCTSATCTAAQGEATDPAYTVEAVQPVRLVLDAHGVEVERVAGTVERTGRVRCECGALAAWEDASQGELFALAPGLF